MKTRLFLLLMIAMLAFAHAKAHAAITYGPEFELTNHAMTAAGLKFDPFHYHDSIEKKSQLAYAEFARQKCVAAGCTVTEIDGKFGMDFAVTFPDGWGFKLVVDPGCIEILMAPASLKDMKRNAARTNEIVFGWAREFGLDIDPRRNGHMNIGTHSAFGPSVENFLKFYVDYANHPDLGFGSLGMDLGNAPPLSILAADQREALQAIVREAKEGKFETVEDVVLAIHMRVHTYSYLADRGGHHYQAMGLKSINETMLAEKDAPFEIRALWMQANAEQFIQAAELFEARIRFTNSRPEPVIYLASKAKNFSSEALVSRFFVYVEETGLRFEKYRSLLPPELREVALAPFFNEQASIEARLASAVEYKDLLLISPYARDLFVRLMNDPAARDSRAAKQWRARLMQDDLGERSALRVGFANVISLIRLRTTTQGTANDHYRHDLLQSIRERTGTGVANRSCSHVFAL